MKIRAEYNTGAALPPASWEPAVNLDAETEFPITIGKDYFVFAITIRGGIAWYYIFDDDDLPWPIWNPAPLFRLIDGTLPASWKIAYYRHSRERQYPVLSFPEWADDRFFYEHLVDGDETAVRVFDERRKEVEESR